MHTVIQDECSGCELCIEPCPVDCIDLVEIASHDSLSEKSRRQRAVQYRQRYEARNARLQAEKQKSRKQHKHAKQADIADHKTTIDERKKAISEAIARSKAKREQRRIVKSALKFLNVLKTKIPNPRLN